MKAISQLIDPSIQQLSRQQERLDRLLKSALPPAGHAHIQVAQIEDRELVVITDSAAWSTRLRLHTRDMLYMLSQHTDLDIRSIRIRLRKQRIKPAAPRRKNKPACLSRSNARLMEQTAAGISDPDLKGALLKLAQRTSPAD